MNLTIDLIELECGCGHNMQAKPKNEEWLTKCHACQTFLMVTPRVRQKPNKVLFEYEITMIPKPQQAPALRAVANQ